MEFRRVLFRSNACTEEWARGEEFAHAHPADGGRNGCSSKRDGAQILRTSRANCGGGSGKPGTEGARVFPIFRRASSAAGGSGFERSSRGPGGVSQDRASGNQL